VPGGPPPRRRRSSCRTPTRATGSCSTRCRAGALSPPAALLSFRSPRARRSSPLQSRRSPPSHRSISLSSRPPSPAPSAAPAPARPPPRPPRAVRGRRARFAARRRLRGVRAGRGVGRGSGPRVHRHARLGPPRHHAPQGEPHADPLRRETRAPAPPRMLLTPGAASAGARRDVQARRAGRQPAPHSLVSVPLEPFWRVPPLPSFTAAAPTARQPHSHLTTPASPRRADPPSLVLSGHAASLAPY